MSSNYSLELLLKKAPSIPSITKIILAKTYVICKFLKEV